MILKARKATGQVFHADLLNNACTVLSRTTKLGSTTHVGEGRISRGQPCPHRKGMGPSSHNFGGSLLFIHTSFDAELPNLMW